MQTSNNTILITGGATGIGLSLAIEFLKRGNEVIICGRRENLLDEVKAKHPQIHTYKTDITKLDERKSLVSSLSKNHPEINVLINNAGIQREFLMNDENVAAKFESENSIKQQEVYLEMAKEIKEKYPKINVINLQNDRDFEETKKELRDKINY